MTRLHPLVPFLVVSSAIAQTPTWTNRTPTNQPAADNSLGICYDVTAKKTLLYGSARRTETWAWDGKAWTRLSTIGPTTTFRRLVYDSKRKRAVMVTGRQTTFEWDGKSWTQNSTASNPQIAGGFQLAYDSKRGVTVMFGGYYGGWTHAGTYEYDGKTWKQRSSGGPPHRINHAMAYDESRGEVIVFGGTGIRNSNDAYYSDTWVWNGSYWREHFGLANPGHRQWASFAYDAVRRVSILYGGMKVTSPSRTYHDTWEWSGTAWKQITTLGQPQLGYTTRMAFDTDRKVAVLTGQNRSVNQTWEYRGGGGVPATFSTFGTGCKGSAGIPGMAARTGSLPRIGTTFVVEFSTLPKSAFSRVMGIAGASKANWGTIPLPFDLTPLGMPGCRLYAAPDLPFVSLPIWSGAATWNLPIPNDARLIGGLFYLQGIVLEPGVNGFGAIMTNAGEGRMGH